MFQPESFLYELDAETGRMILDVLRRVSWEEGRTTLVVTHNAAIGAIADRVVRLRSGAIASDVRNAAPAAVSELDW